MYAPALHARGRAGAQAADGREKDGVERARLDEQLLVGGRDRRPGPVEVDGREQRQGHEREYDRHELDELEVEHEAAGEKERVRESKDDISQGEFFTQSGKLAQPTRATHMP